jgi:hypothetical protein
MIVHKTLGSGISGTVRYVMGEGKRDPKTGKLPTREPGAAHTRARRGQPGRLVWRDGLRVSDR